MDNIVKNSTYVVSLMPIMSYAKIYAMQFVVHRLTQYEIFMRVLQLSIITAPFLSTSGMMLLLY